MSSLRPDPTPTDSKTLDGAQPSEVSQPFESRLAEADGRQDTGLG